MFMESSRTSSESSTESLTVRRLLVDLHQGFSRHWNGGDAFRTAFANALSMSFPVGEQFFIESVRKGLVHLPDGAPEQRLHGLARGFIGQEATHRQLHGQFNDWLSKQGLHNHWAPRAKWRIERARTWRRSHGAENEHLHELAITAAFEHYTAIFGDLVLRHKDQQGDLLEDAEPMLQLLWRWHAAEETEHKAVAFDLFHALGGSYRLRLAWFVFVTCQFAVDVLRQTCNNLWHDGRLFHPSTWWSGLRFAFGPQGLTWRFTGPVLAYLRRDFHPNQVGDNQLAKDWLDAHARQWRAV
jgi:predicted metal-dependent hydrolase